MQFGRCMEVWRLCKNYIQPQPFILTRRICSGSQGCIWVSRYAYLGISFVLTASDCASYLPCSAGV